MKLEKSIRAEEPAELSLESQFSSMISKQMEFSSDDVRKRDNFKDAIKDLVKQTRFTREEGNYLIN